MACAVLVDIHSFYVSRTELLPIGQKPYRLHITEHSVIFSFRSDILSESKCYKKRLVTSNTCLYDTGIGYLVTAFTLSSIVLGLSRLSSTLSIKSTLCAPSLNTSSWAEETALKICSTLSASSTVAMGFTWIRTPGAPARTFTAALTYLPTLVPAPIGCMLNSATTLFVTFGMSQNARNKLISLSMTFGILRYPFLGSGFVFRT